MPSPVSWFHSLSALISVLLKQISSKGNFWQKNRACILCSSVLHYLGTSRHVSPARSTRRVQLWLLHSVPIFSFDSTRLSFAGAAQKWFVSQFNSHAATMHVVADSPFQQYCFRFLLPVFAICRFFRWRKRKPESWKKKKKGSCFSVLYLKTGQGLQIYCYVMPMGFEHHRFSGGYFCIYFICM